MGSPPRASTWSVDRWLRHPAAPWALAGVVGVVLAAPLLRCVRCPGGGDWDFFVTQAEVARRAVLEHGELPLYNPFHCGGQGALQNLQSRVASPSFLLTLLLGPVLGLRLYVALALGLGFEGTRRLALACGAGRWGAAFAAIAVVANGGMAMRIAVGHLGDVPYVWLPWLWLGAMRALERPGLAARAPGVVLGAVTWGAMWLEAGVYPAIFGALVLGAGVALAAVLARSPAPLVVGASILSLGALLAAVQLLPAALFLQSIEPRPIVPEHVPLAALPDVFFLRATPLGPGRLFDAQVWRWFEYGAYLGPVFALGLGAALFSGRGKRVLAFVALAAVAVVVGLGDVGMLSPWRALHALGPLSALQASGRAFLVAVVLLAIAAGVGLDRRAGRFALFFPLVLAADLVSLFLPTVSAGLHDPRPHPERDPAAPFSQSADERHLESMTRENFTRMREDVVANRGVLVCYDAARPRVFAQARVSELLVVEGDASVSDVHRTHRTVGFSVDARGPAVIDVNLNHDPGWTVADEGVRVVSVEGRLAVDVPAGARRVTLRYAPGTLHAGAALGALGAAALAWLWRRRRRGPNTGGA